MAEKLPTGGAGTTIEASLLPSVQDEIDGRVVVEYGDSGIGKSTDAHSVARFYYGASGLPVRLITVEDSSKQVFADLIDAGIVQPLYISKVKEPIVALERIVEGHWPDASGKLTDDSPVLKRGEVSAYIIEGLSTIAELIRDYLRTNRRMMREQKEDAFTIEGRTYAASSQTAFGFTQDKTLELLRISGGLPVERVWWTAHEMNGKDQENGIIRGPALVGSAATNKVRRNCGLMIHADRIEGELRRYVSDHPDPKAPAATYQAKVTLSPLVAEEMRKKYPKGYFVPKLPQGGNYSDEDGVIPFLRFENELRERAGGAAARLKTLVKS